MKQDEMHGALIKKSKPEVKVEEVKIEEPVGEPIVEEVKVDKPKVVGDIADSTPIVEEGKKREYDFLRNIYGEILDRLTGEKFSSEDVALAMNLEKDHSPKYVRRVIKDDGVADMVLKFLDDNPNFNWGAKTVVTTRTKNKAEALRKARQDYARAKKPDEYRKKTNDMEKAQVEDFISDTDQVLKRKAAEIELLRLAEKAEKEAHKDDWNNEGDVINEALKKMRF